MAMEQLTPPTDNLYKFMALAGIVLYLVCLSLPSITVQQLQEKRFQLNEAIISLRADIDETTDDQKILGEDVSKMKKRLVVYEAKPRTKKAAQPLINRATKAEIVRTVDKYEKTLQAIRKKGWQQRKQNALLDQKEKQLQILINRLEREFRLYTCGMIAGGLMALSGFSLWYWRLQRWLDRDAKEPKNTDTAA